MAYTTIDDPTIFFNTVLYTGDGNSTQAVTGVGFQPDWIWIKNRTDGHWNNLNDSIRGAGAGQVLRSNTNSSEGGTSGHVSSFDSDGFTVAAGTSDAEEVNTSSDNYVAWNWKANGSSTVTNSNGNISAAVSVNDTIGFSVMSYTGDGQNARSIGHSLSAKPKIYLIKARSYSSGGGWQMFVEELGAGGRMQLDTNEAFDTSSTVFGNTVPTSSLIYVGGNSSTDSATNKVSATYVCYAFRPIQGYSAMGTYKANGNADGPFVYTGFKPAWLLTKTTDSTYHWNINDNKRNTLNVVDKRLYPSQAAAEATSSNYNIDFLSNGFKIKTSHVSINNSGDDVLYIAFAESPLVNSNGIPNNAR